MAAFLDSVLIESTDAQLTVGTSTELLPLLAFKKALAKNSETDAAVAWRTLLHVEPLRWRELLLIDGGIKDPHAVGFAQQLQTLLKATAIIARELPSEEQAAQIFQLSLGGSAFLTLFSSVRKRLEGLPFFGESRDIQQLRLVAYLESQWLLAHDELLKKTTARGTLDMHKTQATLFENELGTKVSVDAVLEGTIDCIELLLRYAQHTTAESATAPVLSDAKSPYLDPDFERVFRLAASGIPPIQWT